MCIRAPVGATKLLDQGYHEELVSKANVLSPSTKIKPEAHTHLQGSDKKNPHTFKTVVLCTHT